MSDRDALIAAIIEHPDEDTPRLMFADWLMERHDVARGEFVREQVLAGQQEPFSPESRLHEANANRLHEQHGTRWTEHVSEWAIGSRFRRGFIEHLSVNVATFTKHATTIFRQEPLRSLQLVRFAFTGTPVPLDPIFTLPGLERITRLDLGQLGRHPDYFESLDRCAQLPNLTDLSLRNTPVPVNWLRTLLTGTAFPALAGLDLADDAHLSRVIAEALPAAEHRRFKRLDFSHIAFKSDQLKKTLESRCVREIEELRLGWLEGAGDGPLTHLNLGWVIPWAQLRVLDLSGQGVRDEGVTEIVTGACHRTDHAPLRWLGLANNRITADGVRALLNASESRLQLYYLDVRDNGLSRAHLVALKKRFPQAEVLG